MIVKFKVNCLSFSVGGYHYDHEIEIDDECLNGMTEEQKEEYIDEQIYGYINECLDYGITEIIE